MNGASAAVAVSPIPVPTHVGAVRIGKLARRLRDQPGRGGLRGPRDGPRRLGVQRRDPDGRVRRQRRHRGRGPRRARHRPRGDQEDLRARSRSCASKAGKEKLEVEEPKVDPELVEQIRASHGAKLDEATQIPEKLARQEAAKARRGGGAGAVRRRRPRATEADPERRAEVSRAFDKLEKEIIRRRIAVDKKRPDGRAQDEIRPIECEVDISPRVHGSALFTRGETQILSNVALGTSRMDMRVDNLGLVESKTFWHHYNFPPFSVGEAGFMRGPKRRDIGHGALAERALVPTIPSQEDFPYVIRVVSETLESNGSSSMGSVCASSMALMAAGVPVSEPGRRRGDGPDQGGRRPRRAHRHRRRRGSPRRHGLQGRRHRPTGSPPCRWTSRSPGSPSTSCATRSSRPARAGCSSSTRCTRRSRSRASSCRSYAPRIEQIKIDPEKIGALIGKGGETIRALSEEFEADINVEDDGTVQVYAPSGALVDACIARIEAMTKEAEVGRPVHGQGREDDRLRRVRRADQGHRRAAAHLERQARRAGRARSRTS